MSSSGVEASPRVYFGLAIIGVAIGGLFWWGFHFKLFDTDIDWVGKPAEYGGFFAWIVLGAFGAGYLANGIRQGFQLASRTLALFAVAALIGVIKRRP